MGQPAKPRGLCRPPSPGPARRHPDGGTGDQVSPTRKRKPEPAWFEDTCRQGPCRLAPSQQTLGPAPPQDAWLLLQSQQGEGRQTDHPRPLCPPESSLGRRSGLSTWEEAPVILEVLRGQSGPWKRDQALRHGAGEGTDVHTGGLQVWAGGQRLPLNPHQEPGRWHHTPKAILAGYQNYQIF